MMRSSKSTALALAKKCKNILASNWQGNFNTIKADVKESKNEIFTSKVKYFVRKGRPYIWVPEEELHNVNVIMDERSSFAVTTPIPGRLPMLLRSIKKLPSRVALVGDVVPLKEGKVSLASESFTEMISSERKAFKEASYSVSAILNSSNLVSTSRSENLQELLHGDKEYVIYRFNISSCTYIDGNGSSHEVDVEEIEASKADPLSRFSMSLIDGINQSEARRRALVLLCGTCLSKKAKDAYMLSVDTKGFDVLGKVQGPAMSDGSPQYQWKELRFLFKEDACDVETFCNRLVDMEEEAIKNSGLV